MRVSDRADHVTVLKQQLLHLLITRKLTTLSPSTWQDQNDTTYLTRYIEARQIKGLYVLCMTEAADTFHHWNVYANGPSGVKLEFDPGRFNDWLLNVSKANFCLERVQYKKLEEIEEAARETKMLPFLKRKAFRDENEIRLLIEDTESHAVQFPPAVKGMITYTKEFRNFSVVSKDDQARFYSECYVARYTLTDQEYAETSEYLIVDDQIGDKGIS